MNRKILIPAFFVAILLLGGITAIWIQKTVTITVNDQPQSVTFWGFTVNDALIKAGVVLYEGDEITPALADRIGEGEDVRITRASQVVIAADGESQTIVTAEKIPVNFLADAQINLADGDLLFLNGKVIDPETPLAYAPVVSLQIRRATPITLVENGVTQTQEIRSAAETLGSALWEAGIQLYDADQLTPPLETPLMGKPLQVTLKRSQEITVQTQNGTTPSRVLANTVGEALVQAGIPLQGLDYSVPAEEARLPQNGTIRVVHVSEEIIVEQDPIPFDVSYQPAADVPLDTQQIIQVGEYGLTARRVRIVYEDGEEVAQIVDDEWTAREPKNRIVGYGTNVVIQTVSTPDGTFEYWRKVEAYATSYSPCNLGIDTDRCSYRTASGATLQRGVIAVIRSWYNVMQGQTVYIPGYGIATIEDIGAGFSDRHWVDLGFTEEDFEAWSRYVTVYFLTPMPANIMWILD